MPYDGKSKVPGFNQKFAKAKVVGDTNGQWFELEVSRALENEYGVRQDHTKKSITVYWVVEGPVWVGCVMVCKRREVIKWYQGG